jgi:hypothetical protein
MGIHLHAVAESIATRKLSESAIVTTQLQSRMNDYGVERWISELWTQNQLYLAASDLGISQISLQHKVHSTDDLAKHSDLILKLEFRPHLLELVLVPLTDCQLHSFPGEYRTCLNTHF